MSALRFSNHIRISLFTAILISPVACLAQSTPMTPRKNSYVVSVQDLRMSSKGQKAFDKGTQLLAKGDTAGSVAYLDRAIQEYPENYKAYYDLGLAHFRLGHMAEAEESFQRSIDFSQGTFAPPQFGMGMVLCQKQEFSQAEMVLERGLGLEPGSAPGKYFLAWAQYGMNRLLDAERSLQEALLRNPAMSEAFLLLARIHQRQNNLPGMAHDLESYLKINPRGPDSEQAKRLLDRTLQELNPKPIAVILPLLTP